MRTTVFAYKGLICIKSGLDAEGMVNNPTDPGQLGAVIDADYVDVSPEALELLKTIPKHRGSFADLMIFKTNDGKRMFAWTAGPKVILDPKQMEADREYDPSILTPVDGIEIPQEFKDCIDEQTQEQDETPIAETELVSVVAQTEEIVMIDHPECKPYEIYLGNYTDAGYNNVGWKTKRLGVVAYDIYGNEIPQHHEGGVIVGEDNILYPLFIQKSEVSERIAVEKAASNTQTMNNLTTLLERGGRLGLDNEDKEFMSKLYKKLVETGVNRQLVVERVTPLSGGRIGLGFEDSCFGWDASASDVAKFGLTNVKIGDALSIIGRLGNDDAMLATGNPIIACVLIPKEVKEDMIKVRLNGESVWAARLSPTTAEIRNLPLDSRVNYKDIVEIDASHNFIKVIERQQEQAGIHYEYDPATIEQEYQKLGNYLMDNNIGIEGMVIGSAMIHFKKDMKQEDVSKILENAPVKITEVEFFED